MATRALLPLVAGAVAAAVVAVVAVQLGSAAAASAPQWFRDRTPLPSCPAVSVQHGQRFPEEFPRASACAFSPAAARRGAELRVTQLTTEGDPVRTTYRRLPGQPGLEVVVDASDDRYGGGAGWSRSTCPEATSLDGAALGSCHPLD